MKDYIGMYEAIGRGGDVMVEALRKIASPTQTTDLLWWQIEAREALAKVGAGDTAPEGHNIKLTGGLTAESEKTNE